ncbi:hypothetical protein STCU_11833 [Strigomonas culicis]|uniref:Fungal lipase-type domain-containing protein n=1 Tax=Strigomonas culicis TaxID=28005 RepID=S9TH81_9TRYP|nr:hypothetical protein STCU_11833 [Strigomonas culicis]|eukprot:EPY15688.1 hypothetical protein STCU_11833 [Strigomonas culicis]
MTDRPSDTNVDDSNMGGDQVWTVFDPQVTQICALASEASYDVDNGAMPENCELIEKHSNYLTWRVKGKNTVVLAFRGTDKKCLKDLFTDIMQSMVGHTTQDGDNMLVVDGFNQRSNEYIKVAKKYTDECAEKGDTMYITGHSLGAAQSILTTVELTDSDANAVKLLKSNRLFNVNFGCPIVGNKNLEAHIKKKGLDQYTLNVLHRGDLIWYGSTKFQTVVAPIINLYFERNLTGVLHCIRRYYDPHGNGIIDRSSIFGHYLIFYKLDGSQGGVNSAEVREGTAGRNSHTIIYSSDAHSVEAMLSSSFQNVSLSYHEMRNYRVALEDVTNGARTEVTPETDPCEAETNKEARGCAEQQQHTEQRWEEQLREKRAEQKKRWVALWSKLVASTKLSSTQKEHLLASPFVTEEESSCLSNVDRMCATWLYLELSAAQTKEYEEALEVLLSTLAEIGRDKEDDSDNWSDCSSDSIKRPPRGGGGGAPPTAPARALSIADCAQPVVSFDDAPRSRTACAQQEHFLKAELGKCAVKNSKVVLSMQNIRQYLSAEANQTMARMNSTTVKRVLALVARHHRNVDASDMEVADDEQHYQEPLMYDEREDIRMFAPFLSEVKVNKRKQPPLPALEYTVPHVDVRCEGALLDDEVHRTVLMHQPAPLFDHAPRIRRNTGFKCDTSIYMNDYKNLPERKMKKKATIQTQEAKDDNQIRPQKELKIDKKISLQKELKIDEKIELQQEAVITAEVQDTKTEVIVNRTALQQEAVTTTEVQDEETEVIDNQSELQQEAVITAEVQDTKTEVIVNRTALKGKSPKPSQAQDQEDSVSEEEKQSNANLSYLTDISSIISEWQTSEETKIYETQVMKNYANNRVAVCNKLKK